MQPCAHSLTSPPKAGFTLIELSIVLVIIGLLAGGILAGKSLIQSAKYSRLVGNIQKFETAVNAFQDKYQCLPGDCKNATTYWSGATNGNGDNQIAGNCEEFWFWKMLGGGYAELIPGSYSGSPSAGDCRSAPFKADIDLPKTPLAEESVYFFKPATYWGGTLWNINMDTQPKLFVGIWGQGYDISSIGDAAISAKELRSIDKKYDDGIPSSGKILAARSGFYGDGVCTDVDATNGSTSGVYLNTASLDCVIIFDVDFIK